MRWLALSLAALVLGGCVSNKTSGHAEQVTAEATPSGPPPAAAQAFLARAIALRSSRFGYAAMGGRHPISKARIAGPKPGRDLFGPTPGTDLYCVKFYMDGNYTNFGGEVDLTARVSSSSSGLPARIEPNSVCRDEEFRPYPDLEKFNDVRAKRSTFLGL